MQSIHDRNHDSLLGLQLFKKRVPLPLDKVMIKCRLEFDRAEGVQAWESTKWFRETRLEIVGARLRENEGVSHP